MAEDTPASVARRNRLRCQRLDSVLQNPFDLADFRATSKAAHPRINKRHWILLARTQQVTRYIWRHAQVAANSRRAYS